MPQNWPLGADSGGVKVKGMPKINGTPNAFGYISAQDYHAFKEFGACRVSR